MNRVDFSKPPEIGTIIEVDDQTYELADTKPHTRIDGSRTTLLIWRTACPTCGDEFELTSGLVCKALNRRCEEHRTTGKPVKGRRGRAVKSRVIAP